MKRPRHESPRAQRGLTLVELMMALTIMAFGMMALAATQITTMHGAKSGKNLTAAVEVAQNEIESLIRLGWSDLVVADWTTPTKATSVVAASAEILDQNYMVSRRITEPVADTIRSVDVRVTWIDSAVGSRSYALTTQRFNDGG